MNKPKILKVGIMDVDFGKDVTVIEPVNMYGCTNDSYEILKSDNGIVAVVAALEASDKSLCNGSLKTAIHE